MYILKFVVAVAAGVHGLLRGNGELPSSWMENQGINPLILTHVDCNGANLADPLQQVLYPNDNQDATQTSMALQANNKLDVDGIEARVAGTNFLDGNGQTDNPAYLGSQQGVEPEQIKAGYEVAKYNNALFLKKPSGSSGSRTWGERHPDAVIGLSVAGAIVGAGLFAVACKKCCINTDGPAHGLGRRLLG